MLYIAIGTIIWQFGYVEAPNIKEGVFTFLYIVLLWPIIIMLKIFG